ncbi:MAG: hypothetical protein P8J86_01715 [Phycisphaerales bacterium]|nr:hypothetical protein [Phycisphaerales bacterium]
MIRFPAGQVRSGDYLGGTLVDNTLLIWPVEQGARAVQVVVLDHVLPDGSRHWDLLVARDVAKGSPLWSLRCDERPDTAPPGTSLALTRTPDHNAKWLDGSPREVSGGRGVAERVASGLLRIGSCDAAIVQWEDGRTSVWRLADGQLMMLDD